MNAPAMTIAELQQFFERGPEEVLADPEASLAHEALLAALETGRIRAAERGQDGTWRANAWVKRAILAGFRRTGLVQLEVPGFPCSTSPRSRPGRSRWKTMSGSCPEGVPSGAGPSSPRAWS